MTLNNFYQKFTTKEDCLIYLEKILWNNKPTCPYCNSVKITKLKQEFRYHCNNCNTSFSLTVNTMFHKTKIDLQKWFYVLHLILNNEEKRSIRQLAKEINTTKDTALRVLNKVKKSIIKQDIIIQKFNIYEH